MFCSKDAIAHKLLSSKNPLYKKVQFNAVSSETLFWLIFGRKIVSILLVSGKCFPDWITNELSCDFATNIQIYEWLPNNKQNNVNRMSMRKKQVTMSYRRYILLIQEEKGLLLLFFIAPYCFYKRFAVCCLNTCVNKTVIRDKRNDTKNLRKSAQSKSVRVNVYKKNNTQKMTWLNRF